MSTPRPEAVEASRTLPVIEEVLHVETRAVDQGGYRVVKRVEARDELVDELLYDERVEIERRPINTALADGAIPPARQEGDTLIVPVVEEILITVKRLMLVEEVRITRVRSSHRSTQRVTLRREEIEVERLAAAGAAAADPS